MDLVSMGTLIPHQFGAWFYPFHVAKFSEPIKELAIDTTNVENLPSSHRYWKRTQGFNDEFCSSAPPPVLAVELAIDAAVSLVHKVFGRRARATVITSSHQKSFEAARTTLLSAV
jgi:hypothetical protein